MNSPASMAESQPSLSRLPTLGVGIGFREPFRCDLFLARDRVDFLEITADHYLDASPEKARELDLLAQHFSLIPHGLNLSLGSAEGLDPDYLKKFEALVAWLNPPWWSEHVAFTRAGGVEIGHLAPVPFSNEALGILETNINEATRRIRTPLIVENITYTIPLPGREMGEGAFLAELTRRTGCGLLLDVTNLYTNAVNHGFDPSEVLDQLPLDRVVQLHFAGGEWHDGQLIDNHARPAPPEVWALLEEVVARAPVKGIILERDDDLPPLGELLDEVDRARSIMKAHRR